MATPRWWSASLPDDIIKDILTWLPPKPLIRFKCVRQSWNSKIYVPEFINKQLSMNKAKSLSLEMMITTTMVISYVGHQG